MEFQTSKASTVLPFLHRLAMTKTKAMRETRIISGIEGITMTICRVEVLIVSIVTVWDMG